MLRLVDNNFQQTSNISDHYYDVIVGAMASQITSLTIVYSTVYSDADQRKHQSPTSRGKWFHLITSSCAVWIHCQLHTLQHQTLSASVSTNHNVMIGKDPWKQKMTQYKRSIFEIVPVSTSAKYKGHRYTRWWQNGIVFIQTGRIRSILCVKIIVLSCSAYLCLIRRVPWTISQHWWIQCLELNWRQTSQ